MKAILHLTQILNFNWRESGAGKAAVGRPLRKGRGRAEGGIVRESSAGEAAVGGPIRKGRARAEGGVVRESGAEGAGKAAVGGPVRKGRGRTEGSEGRELGAEWRGRQQWVEQWGSVVSWGGGGGGGSWAPGAYEKSTKNLATKISRVHVKDSVPSTEQVTVPDQIGGDIVSD